MDPKFPGAEALVRKYLDGNPKALAEIRMAYARNLLDVQRYAEASAQLQVVTREKPDYPEGWLVLGSLQLQDNQLAASQTSLLRYVALATQGEQNEQTTRGLSQAYLSLAQLAEKRRDFTGAESWLAKISIRGAVQAQTRRASRWPGKQSDGSAPADPAVARAQARGCAYQTDGEITLLRDPKEYKSAYELLTRAVAQFPAEPVAVVRPGHDGGKNSVHC